MKAPHRRPTRWERAGSLAALVLLAASVAGCTVGSGSGSAKGSLWVNGCGSNGSNYGTPPMQGNPAVPRAYDLQPTFFAGEPIEDLSTSSNLKNRLILRMQGTGLAIQYNDTLYFDVEDSYEVARCVRGRTIGGQPDWNVTEPLYDQTPTPWCDWSASAAGDGGTTDGGIEAGAPDAAATALDGGAALDGGTSVMAAYPRIYITPDTDLRSSLALLSTCPTANISADAVDTPATKTAPAAVSWIEFLNFGQAEQSDLPPEMRTPIGSDFVINYGERLRANFHLVLQDGAVINAIENLRPAPAPLVGGTLDGYFDFSLERGRAAQAFP
ncbi:MAG TPA: hypothetical protein VFG23_14360 [Polyangia bacterium]|nr:hypothetical protein [Polyangia bacterium]